MWELSQRFWEKARIFGKCKMAQINEARLKCLKYGISMLQIT